MSDRETRAARLRDIASRFNALRQTKFYGCACATCTAYRAIDDDLQALVRDPDPEAAQMLEVSEWHRPVVYLAESSWYGGQSSNRCVFATRDQAVAWAKGQIIGTKFVPDAPRWEGDGKYPYEWERDRIGLTPTFCVEWFDQNGGEVSVTRVEVEGTAALVRAERPRETDAIVGEHCYLCSAQRNVFVVKLCAECLDRNRALPVGEDAAPRACHVCGNLCSSGLCGACKSEGLQ